MPSLDRRRLLQTLALAPVGAALPNALQAQAMRAGLVAGNVCLLAPELTEGPFYLDPALLRSDITEGRPGTPLALRLQVVTADCAPIPGARVDVWHCDAAGAYSGVRNGQGGPDSTGQTYLRGTQTTDASGIAQFQTIYPGWYPGRAVHVHYKVILPSDAVLTSQMFFGDATSRQIYAADAAYAGRGTPDVPHGADRIARSAGDGALGAVEVLGGVLTASLVVGVNPEGGGFLKSIFG